MYDLSPAGLIGFLNVARPIPQRKILPKCEMAIVSSFRLIRKLTVRS